MASSLLILILSIIATSNEVASILFGQQANLGEYKFAASIYEGGYFTCSGAILNGRFILTAGHCICDKTLVSLKVIVGVVRVTDANKAAWLDVATVRCSDGFQKVPNTKVYEHDIGLIKLKNPLVASCTIGPIRLSFDSGSYLRIGCKLILFRENDKYDFYMQTSVHTMDLSLRWSTVNIPSREDCLPWIYTPLVNEICALNIDQNEESIRPGDSGAPIVCGGKLFAILVSTMSRTVVKGATVLQVANYLPWIARIVNFPQY